MQEDSNQLALDAHEAWRGKIEILPRVKADDAQSLALCYTPGVAQPCLAIAKDPSLVNKYTRKWNTVAVVTDGTAVLGLGDIGPEAALPVMEGKAVLFKQFGDVDAIPICLATKDVEEIVRTVELIAPTFGGINLEDIAAPRCFEIEAKLKERLSIPVFHDDQHGTAVVVLSALIGGCKVLGKDALAQKVVINGAGAAGIAIARLLAHYGVGDIILCDKEGVISDRSNPVQAQMASQSNPRGIKGTLADAMRGADVVIGVSGPGAISGAMVASMAQRPMVFALANPTPEIAPEAALAAGAAIVATGRSDYPNQINNVLVFPGLFRGVLDAQACAITDGMKIAAAQAIADILSDDERGAECILPSVFDVRVAAAVARAVRNIAKEESGL